MDQNSQDNDRTQPLNRDNSRTVDDKVKELKETYDEMGDKVDELVSSVKGDEEEDTELYGDLYRQSWIKVSTKRGYDTLIGQSQEDNDPDRKRVLELEQLGKLMDSDLTSLRSISENVPDPDVADDLIESINEQRLASISLLQEINASMEPSQSDTSNTDNQDGGESSSNRSSLLDDFANPSTEPMDYTGGDD
jgi:hypothetical protein